MKYTPFEIERMSKSMTVLVDTREHPNKRFDDRVASFGYPWERCRLDFGDYSCKYVNADGEEVSLASSLAIERKMNADELATCFGTQRARFEREFIRAKESGAKIYLIVEDETWETLHSGIYRSKLPAKSLVGSIHAWQARYQMNIQFVDHELTGLLIADILRAELREKLKNE